MDRESGRVRIGIDLAAVRTVEDLLARHADPYPRRIPTFAAKEATFKIIGAARRYSGMAIDRRATRRLRRALARVTDDAEATARAGGIRELDVSFAHERPCAAARAAAAR